MAKELVVLGILTIEIVLDWIVGV